MPIGGPTLALGHLGLPEATAAAEARFTTLDGELLRHLRARVPGRLAPGRIARTPLVEPGRPRLPD